MLKKIVIFLSIVFICACQPAPTPTLTATATFTSTPTLTSTFTQTSTVTPTETLIPRITNSKTPVPTKTVTETFVPMPTFPLQATRTSPEDVHIVQGFEDTSGRALVWSDDGAFLFIGTDDKGLVAYIVELDELGPFVGNNAKIETMGLSADGNTLLVGLSDDGSIRMISTITGAMEGMIWPAHNGWPQGIAVDINNDWFVSCSWNGEVFQWDYDGELIREIETDFSCGDVAITPNGRYLLIGNGAGSQIRVIDTNDWTIKKEFSADQCEDLDISPDGRRVITAGGGIHEANVWDIFSGEHVFNLREHPSWVYAVAYSPTGEFMVSGGLGPSVIVWDAGTGEAILELSVPGSDFIQALAFSPDGKTLAGAGVDVYLWDVSEIK